MIRFLVWSQAPNFKGWFRGMLTRLVVIGLLIAGVAWAVLNPQNPAYNPTERAALDAQAQTFIGTGTRPQRWDELIRSASTECHYRSARPQEFMISGTLADQYIESGTGKIRWYVRFPANLVSLQPTLFGPSTIRIGIVTMQTFYGITKTDGFDACTVGQALQAHTILGL